MHVDAGSVVAHAARVSVAELLVALAIFALVGLAAFALLDAGERAWTVGSARAATQETARVALARLAGEIRLAGHGGRGFDAVAVAAADSIVLQQDLNGDGAIAANGERVTWRLVDSVLRRDAGGGLQPIVNGVGAFALSYFDAEGRPTTVPSAVRHVEIVIVTKPDVSPPLIGASTVLGTGASLRNR